MAKAVGIPVIGAPILAPTTIGAKGRDWCARSFDPHYHGPAPLWPTRLFSLLCIIQREKEGISWSFDASTTAHDDDSHVSLILACRRSLPWNAIAKIIFVEVRAQTPARSRCPWGPQYCSFRWSGAGLRLTGVHEQSVLLILRRAFLYSPFKNSESCISYLQQYVITFTVKPEGHVS